MNSRLLLCVGPHRSGTSVAAAALEALGAHLDLPAQPYLSTENPKGFYEHPGAVALNEEILAGLGTTWDTVTLDLGSALMSADAELREKWVTSAADLIRDVIQHAPLAAIKDPRICLLAPLWIQAAERAGISADELAFVFAFRDPIEAALSQAARVERRPDFYEFGRLLIEGVALWLTYTARFFGSVEGCKVAVLSHAAVINDPQGALVRLASVFGQIPDSERIRGFAQGFVDEELYRSRPETMHREIVRSALPASLDIAEVLVGAASEAFIGEASRRRIVDLWQSPRCLDQMAQAVLPSLGRLNRKARDASLAAAGQEARLAQMKSANERDLARKESEVRARLQAQAEQLEGRIASLVDAANRRDSEHRARLATLAERAAADQREIQRLRAECTALINYQRELMTSTSWRVTAPLRAVRKVLR